MLTGWMGLKINELRAKIRVCDSYLQWMVRTQYTQKHQCQIPRDATGVLFYK